MAAARSALVIATHEYADPKLRRLRAPARDADELARVLGDPAVGNFEVEVLTNEPEHVLRRKLGAFFDARGLDDLLLLHVSGHGVKDEDGRLYFATADTELAQLEATAIPAEFVNRQMTRSRSRRIILLLDCCYSGAFASGLMARGGDRVEVGERFEGRGRVVLTASSAMEYAFEGGELSGAPNPSVFTSAVVRGLETGAADRDRDGWISVDELYDFAFEEVREATPSQTPGKWTFGVQGDLFVAQSALAPAPEQLELPAELRSATASPFAHVRAGAVLELAALQRAPDARLVRAAREALAALARDDSRHVSELAARAFADAGSGGRGSAERELPPAPARTPAARTLDRVATLVRGPLPAAMGALAGAIGILLALVLPLAGGASVLGSLTRHANWDVLFVFSPIELIPAALAAAVLGFAVRLDASRAALIGSVLAGLGALVATTSAALFEFFGFRGLGVVPILAAAALLAAGGALVRSRSHGTHARSTDRVVAALAGAGAAALIASVFVDYEVGASLIGAGAAYALEPLVGVAAILAALGVGAVGRRPTLAAGLLLAVGGLTALHGLGVVVAAVGAGSGTRTAGFVGILGGVLAGAAGARAARAGGRS